MGMTRELAGAGLTIAVLRPALWSSNRSQADDDGRGPDRVGEGPGRAAVIGLKIGAEVPEGLKLRHHLALVRGDEGPWSTAVCCRPAASTTCAESQHAKCDPYRHGAGLGSVIFRERRLQD